MNDSLSKNLQEIQEMECRKANREKARNDAIACLNPATSEEMAKAENIIDGIIAHMGRFNISNTQPEPITYGLALSKLLEKAKSFSELLDELRSDLLEMSSDPTILSLKVAIDEVIPLIQGKIYKKPGPKYQSHRRELVLRCADALITFGIKPCFSKESGNVSMLSIALHKLITGDSADLSTIKSECVKVKGLFQNVRFAPDFEATMRERAFQSTFNRQCTSYTDLFNKVRAKQLKRLTRIFRVVKRYRFSFPPARRSHLMGAIKTRLKILHFMKYMTPRRKKAYGDKPKVPAAFKNAVAGVRSRKNGTGRPE